MDPRAPQTGSSAGHVTLRYWASARAAAGTAEDRIDVPGPVSLASVVATAVALHPESDRLEKVLDCCSVLRGDQPVGSADRESVLVEPGDSVEFLPPFAGG